MSATSRVLVVDDSAFMRKIICDLIAGDSQFTIIGTAKDGREAIEAVREHKPDVVTMDLEMPEMNGLEAVERIMRIYPVPIIMMSSISDDGTRETIKALQNGAFDFIRKPAGPQSPDIRSVGEQLLEKLRVAAMTKRHSKFYVSGIAPPRNAGAITKPAVSPPPPKQKPDKRSAGKAERKEMPALLEPLAEQAEPNVRHPAAEEKPAAGAGKELARSQTAASNEPEPPLQPMDKPKPSKAFQHLVAIGTSTGGPRALHEVISSLPKDFPAPVLVVQHMPPKFTRSLAQRLDSFSALHVREAEQGERVFAGVVYVAPGGYHMELAKVGGSYSIKLTEDAPRSGHRPSVDTMFESCAEFPELRRHAVLMTGMGNDGAKGMLRLNDCGGESAIAESEETCVVYGMPRSAVEAGAAKAVLRLKEIAPALVQAVSK
ncbi:protein-glutamate methylesterase/protein-glutamine glutaminase [Paenibacillus glycinis]|uniref:Protein-glutamate methylesterase/protein-glutamine glutaminase n=1 Tax=Paenibacillus glycinis TaxID=2697035 RepID=A0ABW9XIM9_9BACL|nr:chemotaxis response regulator protein-glutamate methylesterase [Paenibacillus glycinis]NBD22449.1 chemotaxis-specific protein-glutamate methyltransferase CheB [Paenibacillus glycinis]